jgi:hypothetical protein
MKFYLKKPCANCPFRTDIKPFLTQSRAQEICTSLIDHQQTFPCHKTLDYSNHSRGKETDKTQHCAGSMIMLEHINRPNQMMRFAKRFNAYNKNELEMDSPVFQSAEDFIENQN